MHPLSCRTLGRSTLPMKVSLLIFNCCGVVGAFLTASPLWTARSPSNLRYQPDAFRNEPAIDVFPETDEGARSTPHLSVSSKLLFIEDCSLDLFVQMMTASYSFGEFSCSAFVFPSDPVTRPIPNDDARMLHKLPSSSLQCSKWTLNSLDSLLVDMPLSTFDCVELAGVEAWIPPDLYKETTLDAMSRICLTQYSLTLKLLIASNNVKGQMKGAHEPKLPRTLPCSAAALAPTDGAVFSREMFIMEDTTKLNPSIGSQKGGMLIHYNLCQLIDVSRIDSPLQKATDGGVLLHFQASTRTGKVLWYKSEMGEGRIQPDVEFGLQILPFQHHLGREMPETAYQRISFRVVWRKNRSSGRMEGWAELQLD